MDIEQKQEQEQQQPQEQAQPLSYAQWAFRETMLRQEIVDCRLIEGKLRCWPASMPAANIAEYYNYLRDFK